MLTAFAVALICATFPFRMASAQELSGEPLISPAIGGAGSLFQIVGQGGWTPGETVTLDFAFSDTPARQISGPSYHEREVTVLRDGTWSFPIVVNADLFPFPLYRPGYIVVMAHSATKTAVNSYVYTVDGRAPAALPPLAELGSGPTGSGAATIVGTLALFVAGAGALLAASGAMRRV